MKKNSVDVFFEQLEKENETLKKWRSWINIEKELIKQITDTRIKKGISQSELAELTGLKQPAIARIENNENSPQLNTLIKLIDSLDLEFSLVPKDKTEYSIVFIKYYEGVSDIKVNEESIVYSTKGLRGEKNEYKTIQYTC